MVVPEAGEGAQHGSCSHAHGKPHHEAHLDPVKTAGLGLSVRTDGYGHLRIKAQKGRQRTDTDRVAMAIL